MEKYVAKIETPCFLYEINDGLMEVKVTKTKFPTIQVNDNNDHYITMDLAEMRALIQVFTEIDAILPEPEEYK